MNRTDVVTQVQRGKRTFKAADAAVSDVLLEQMGLCDRALEDKLPSDGVATSEEIREGLGLEDA